MKRFFSLILAAVCLTLAVSCTDAVQNYRYKYDLDDYVELCDYRGIEVKTYEYSVTERDVESQILLCRSRYSDIETVDRPARLYDIVYITYEATVDGESVAGDEGAELVLGSYSFIDGFEEGIIGASAGETLNLKLTFPDPYTENPDFSGKEAEFKVTVDEVCEQELPEYNDEFVKTYYGYSTVAEFEVGVREMLEEKFADNLEKYIINQAWNYILDNSKPLRIPTAEYDEFYSYQLETVSEEASLKGKTLSEYVTSELGYESEAAFYTDLQRSCEDWVYEEMVMYAIARRENITLSNKEYESGAKEYADYYQLASIEELESYFLHDDIRENLLFDKVMTAVGNWTSKK